MKPHGFDPRRLAVPGQKRLEVDYGTATNARRPRFRRPKTFPYALRSTTVTELKRTGAKIADNLPRVAESPTQ